MESSKFWVQVQNKETARNKDTILFSIFQASHPTDSKPAKMAPLYETNQHEFCFEVVFNLFN